MYFAGLGGYQQSSGLGCGGDRDCGCGCDKNKGVGFLPPSLDSVIDAPSLLDPSTYDFGEWDWHQWALAAVATYLAYRTVKGAAVAIAGAGASAKRRASGAVSRRKQHAREVGRHVRGALFG